MSCEFELIAAGNGVWALDLCQKKDLRRVWSLLQLGFKHVVLKAIEEADSMDLPEEKKNLLCKIIPLLIIYHCSTLGKLIQPEYRDPHNPSPFAAVEWENLEKNIDTTGEVDANTTASICKFCEFTATHLTNALSTHAVWVINNLSSEKETEEMVGIFLQRLSYLSNLVKQVVKNELSCPNGKGINYYEAAEFAIKYMAESHHVYV